MSAITFFFLKGHWKKSLNTLLFDFLYYAHFTLAEMRRPAPRGGAGLSLIWGRVGLENLQNCIRRLFNGQSKYF